MRSRVWSGIFALINVIEQFPRHSMPNLKPSIKVLIVKFLINKYAFILLSELFSCTDFSTEQLKCLKLFTNFFLFANFKTQDVYNIRIFITNKIIVAFVRFWFSLIAELCSLLPNA